VPSSSQTKLEAKTTQGPSLDSRLPRGPHTFSREQVAANQRERLINGMIELVGQQGYAATTVSEVSARAGVSRKSFYQHYANKQVCFLAAYDAILTENLERVTIAADDGESLHEQGNLGLETLFSRILANRHRARLVLVEIGALGPAGVARREELVGRYEGLLREGIGAAPRPGTIPNPLVRAVVGGFLKVLYTRVQSGAQAQLPTLVPDLMSWAFSYHPLPECMQALRELRPSHPPGALVGGRAPGTLSPGSMSNRRRMHTRRTSTVSRSYVVHSQRERILDATAQLSAAKGYAAFTAEHVAERASVSLQAFYEHFSDKEDAFLVAYEVGHGKGLAIAEHAYDTAPDRLTGVRAALTALFEFLASEPAFAHMALMDALIATQRTADRSDKGVMSYAGLLKDYLDEAYDEGTISALAVEAIGGGIFELCLSYAARGHIGDLSELVPWATYFVLAPFVGAEHAARVATEHGPSEPSPPAN
jgi:AcrR family transcriptional regulator